MAPLGPLESAPCDKEFCKHLAAAQITFEALSKELTLLVYV